MTVAAADTLTWTGPPEVAPRGTLVVLPGRGEHPGIYERFGRRIAVDGYRVTAVADPVIDAVRAAEQVVAALDGAPGPHVLVGSDTGALLAAALVADGQPAVDALVLAGVPAGSPGAPEPDGEVDARTACPTHAARIAGPDGVRSGALAERVPDGWLDRADPARIGVPVLGLHGAADAVAPLDAARAWYARVPRAELVAVAGGRHDALNDATHRTAAASVVLFLERLRLGADLPLIAQVTR